MFSYGPAALICAACQIKDHARCDGATAWCECAGCDWLALLLPVPRDPP